MWAGRGFGVILHRKSWFIFQFETGYRTIVQMKMGDFKIRMPLNILFGYVKTMVLGGDFALSRKKVFDRVVDPSMAMVHFVSTNVTSAGQQLMAETYSKQRLPQFQYFLSRRYRVIHYCRIAGTIRKEIGVGTPLFYFFDRGFGGKYFAVDSPIGEIL